MTHSMQESDVFDPFDTARYCLRYIAPRTDREGWIQVGMACHSIGEGRRRTVAAEGFEAEGAAQGKAVPAASVVSRQGTSAGLSVLRDLCPRSVRR